jgi:hypothetical protein
MLQHISNTIEGFLLTIFAIGYAGAGTMLSTVNQAAGICSYVLGGIASVMAARYYYKQLNKK